MVKRDRALRNKDEERFWHFLTLVANEIREAKSSFYENKVRPKRKLCPKEWWKNINTIVGKKTTIF